MDTAEVKEWVTVFGAGIAAISGSWSLWLQLRGKRDCYVVEFGSVAPTTCEETMLSVVNLSDYPIQLGDYGFIEADGSFSSIRLGQDTMEIRPEELVHRGSTRLLGRGDIFEIGYVHSGLPIGAFAKSVTRRRPRLGFSSDAPHYRRIWIRLRLLVTPDYFSWTPWGWRFKKKRSAGSLFD